MMVYAENNRHVWDIKEKYNLMRINQVFSAADCLLRIIFDFQVNS